MYTFLDGSGGVASPSGANLPGGNGPDTENTIKSKTGSNDDVKKRMEDMQKRRETEFSGIARK
jgi:hypothetical protein